ncbi:MAG: DUF4349 domain-containing protein [Herpetosiphonaceae bacterium]|nr:DUF4349 domain-containing protein [Herpetosiphonaceae bacterium]
MKRLSSWMIMVVLTATFLSGCGGSASTPASSGGNFGSRGATDNMAGGAATMAAMAGAAGGQAESIAAPAATAASGASPDKGGTTGQGKVDTAGVQNATFGNDANRKIIKNGDLTVQVENVTIGISRITTVATANGGYILQVKSADQSGEASSATLSFAVPVDHFEIAMQGVREASKKVLSEQASGQDVSQEFVDVQSQIANLEATQARVRTFLDQAKTVDEALKVNAQLSDLEGQINQQKGRLQFLSQRTAFSTITVQLQQIIGPTPTPTAEPTPTPIPWHASDTVQAASSTLRGILQAVAQVGIWLGIVVAPLLLPLIVVLLLVRSLRSRSPRRPRLPPTASGDGPAGPTNP